MIEIEKPKIECVEASENGSYGKFVIEPLERGYGITLGNSLRRILLSSLPGYAINTLKIDKVAHEFSTIPGVSEDVTNIILNLKEVCLKSLDTDVKELKISKKERKDDWDLVVNSKGMYSGKEYTNNGYRYIYLPMKKDLKAALINRKIKKPNPDRSNATGTSLR